MDVHMLSVECLRTASAQEIAAARGSEAGWRFKALRFFSSLVIFLSVECKDHTCHWILRTLKKLLLLSPFKNRRQLIRLLTSNFLCFWSFLNKLWSCVLTRVTTVATTHLRKGQTTMGREKNTSESAPELEDKWNDSRKPLLLLSLMRLLPSNYPYLRKPSSTLLQDIQHVIIKEVWLLSIRESSPF